MRANSLRDKISELNDVEERNSIEITKKLLSLCIDKNVIMESTGL